MLKSTVLFSLLPPAPFIRLSLCLLFSRLPGADWGDARRPVRMRNEESGGGGQWLVTCMIMIQSFDIQGRLTAHSLCGMECGHAE